MTTPKTSKHIRWGTERRLEFVEFRLFWEGGVNRSDIIERFGVSVPQASKDLNLYQKLAPANIRYDRSEKRYFASQSFRPKFITLDAAVYLEQLAQRVPAASDGLDRVGREGMADKSPLPQRRIKAEVLRAFVTCARAQRSIEILYQSMSEGRAEPEWRRISPHAFGSDGLRWHARAYCHRDKKFKDFILSRCLDVREEGVAIAAAPEDRAWNTHFTVLLRPNPRLNPSQQEVIAQDFAMENGEAAVPVRCALLYYFQRRLRLDMADRIDDASEAPVVVKNAAAFHAALSEAMR